MNPIRITKWVDDRPNSDEQLKVTKICIDQANPHRGLKCHF